MKKLLSIAVIALMGAGAAMAQSTIVSSRSVSITREKAPSNTTWIVRAGVNVMGVAGEGADGLNSKAGYDFAVSFEKPISDFGFNWGMELGLTSRGFGVDTGDSDASASLMGHGIRFSPITFGYAYNITDDVKIAAHFGGYVSVDYTASFKASYQGESESVGIGDMEDMLGWEYNRFDGGIALGGGFWYKRVNLDVTWQRGFNAIVKDSKCYTSNVMIRLGYAF